uniref:Uncharacterized protein n=1 Tax=Romanomermis culicivorax TaxID=13658 RepID=A0A915IXX8_ROMCU
MRNKASELHYETTKCAPDRKTVTSNLSCVTRCLYKYTDSPTECSPLGHLVHTGDDVLDNACMGVVQFLDDLRLPSKRALKPNIGLPGNKFYPDKPFRRELNRGNATEVEQTFKKCLDKCPLECEQWSYSFSYSKLTVYRIPSRLLIKNTTNVNIEYPLEEDILMLIDAEGLTWYDFIGNVGGIIGIWIGASIISVLQLIYVLCCVDKKWWSKARLHPSVSKNGSTSSKIKITVNKNVTVSPAKS